MSQFDPECGGRFEITRRPDLERGGSPFICDVRIKPYTIPEIIIKGLNKSDLQTMKKEITRALKEAKNDAA